MRRCSKGVGGVLGVAAASVVLLIVDAFVATMLEAHFGRIALDVGFGVPILCGVAGLLAKVVEAACVKRMPDERRANVIQLTNCW